ncbi:MAG TPA: sigma-70 family RNA polymerase sigma factor [Planctomycetota bacterium]|nr:sigma-70 family RNA polymerase sigma factor [Planctomycetota bacterium]
MQDSERFTREWTKAQPVVASYIGAVIRDFNTAEDLLQDVAVVLLNRFNEYDPARSFTGWALGIAKFKILEAQRNKIECLAGDEGILDALSASHEELSSELERRTMALRECLLQIKGRALTLLKLRYDQALKPAAIAAEMGMNAGAVRVMLSRTRQTLYECILKRL